MKGKIIGAGSYAPPAVSDDVYFELFHKEARIVSKLLPHHSRYCALDFNTGKAFTTNTEMAYQASINAINNAGLKPDDIDLIVYSTATPDYPIPPCFALLQDRLGISKCMGFDIRSGCAGFGTAMYLALSLIESSAVHNVLVVGADLISNRFSEFIQQKSSIGLRALFNLMFFGDGAGAVVLQGTDESDSSGFYYKDMESTMADVPYGSIIEIGGSRYPYPTDEVKRERWPLYQASKVSGEYLPKVLIYAMHKFNDKVGTSASDIDHYLMPVISKKMIKIVCGEFPDLNLDKVITVSNEGGALLNAAIPIALTDAIEKGCFKKGDNILMYAAENTKWQHALLAFKW